MSPKLPVISGDDLIRALGKFGYVAVRQRAAMSAFVTPPIPSAFPLLFPFTKKSPLARFAEFSATLESRSSNS